VSNDDVDRLYSLGDHAGTLGADRGQPAEERVGPTDDLKATVGSREGKGEELQDTIVPGGYCLGLLGLHEFDAAREIWEAAQGSTVVSRLTLELQPQGLPRHQRGRGASASEAKADEGRPSCKSD
jgi:hypothetical protein